MNKTRHSAADAAMQIRELNDQFRKTLEGGAVLFTSGILALGPRAEATILEAIRMFNAFNADNDPYGEHDFGRVVVEGNEIFFKIDYYDRMRAHLADDPADPDATERVMTVMLASEY